METDIELLYQKWKRMGVNFPAFEASNKAPLIEELIAQTSIVGRYEPRLIECMAGWIQKHGSLIKASLMRKYLAAGDSAVIGLILDLLDSKETLKLRRLSKYCTPKKKAEMLFYAADHSPTMKSEAIEKEAEINRKWNLFYVSLKIKTDAILERKQVLKMNPNLGHRR